MADVGDNNFMRYVYRGEEGEIIPREATHITVHEDCTVVRAEAFAEHPNIVEVICHTGVEKIEPCAFSGCLNLRRVIMPGVRVVEEEAFYACPVLTDVECGELELIKEWAFRECDSLKSIDVPSARFVEEYAFGHCPALTNVKFGSKLESFEGEVFYGCRSLERITIPLKYGIISADNTFQLCENLKQVDLIDGELHKTIAALQLEDWRNDMNREIDSINQILPNASAGRWDFYDVNDDDPGEKALAVRMWIRSVIRKITRYQAEHQRLLDEAVSTLQHALPHDILMNNVLPFLALTSYTFEEHDHVMEEDGSDGE